MLFARGVELAPFGSIEDRVMREMVFRERQERVALFEGIGRMIARVFGDVDYERAFGGIRAEYAAQVFQETYDPALLEARVRAARAAQLKVREARERDQEMLRRLERMGEFYDQNPPPPSPSKKRNQNK